MNKITVHINQDERKIVLDSKQALSDVVLGELVFLSTEDNMFEYKYKCDLLPSNCFVLINAMKHTDAFEIDPETYSIIEGESRKSLYPSASLFSDKILIEIPPIRTYLRFVRELSGSHYMLNKYRVPLGRLYKLRNFMSGWEHPFLPPFLINETMQQEFNLKIKAETLEDFHHIDLSELYSIRNAWRLNTDGFKKLKIQTASDILFKIPLSYETRIDIHSDLKTAPLGKFFTYKIKPDSWIVTPRGAIIFTHGKTTYTIYGGAYRSDALDSNSYVYLNGIQYRKGHFIAKSWCTEFEVKAYPVVAKYKSSPTNNIKSDTFSYCVDELFSKIDGDFFCDYGKYPYTFWNGVKLLHKPKSTQQLDVAMKTLTYYELLFLQLIFLEQKKTLNRPVLSGYELVEESINKLPFKLTEYQEEAINEIKKHLRDPHSNDMLITGDVGSGKTIVALEALLMAVSSGYQGVIIAPTEVLASQLYKNIKNECDKIGVEVEYVSGLISNSNKKKIQEDILEGKVQIVVGTHSLINMKYKNLGLYIIDEEQKFGTSQRNKLSEITNKFALVPHKITQTATPIPRTAALTFYGSTDLIQIAGKPRSRKEIITKSIYPSDIEQVIYNKRHALWGEIEKHISKGQKVFIVTSAVNQNEVGRISAKEVYEKMVKISPKDYNICLLHGGMTKENQNKEIMKFKENGNILIASSIVEVGVDIPEATLMIVLDANCFGASSLHQIRGRVGRNGIQSYCYLVSGNEEVNPRIESLVRSNNGFDIAMADLELRNVGDILGDIQSGDDSRLRFTNFTNYSEIGEKAARDAIDIYNNKELRDRALSDAHAYLKL